MDLPPINKSYQYLICDLLDLVMHLFFQIQDLQLLILDMDGQEVLINLIMLFYVFFGNIVKVKHFCIVLLYYYVSFFCSYILDLCLFHMHMHIESVDYIILSSLELLAILLTTSVKTLCLSLLNICCVFNIGLFFNEFFFICFKAICIISFFSK